MDEITNIIAFAVSITTLLFTIWYWRIFGLTIVIPAALALCSITYGLIPVSINNMMYDFTSALISVTLIIEKLYNRKLFYICSNPIVEE